jgi:two-component system response regulator AtoC
MPTAPLHLLIIEDQKFNTDLFRAAFSDHTITAAYTGEEGLAAYQAARPDMVFLDLGLPDMSGFDVLEKLRTLDATAYVVMLTGMNNEAYSRRSRELGAAGFLGKPYQKDNIEYYITRYRQHATS